MATKVDLKTEQLHKLCKKFNVKDIYLDQPHQKISLKTVTLILLSSLIARALKERLINSLILSKSSSKSMVGLLTYII